MVYSLHMSAAKRLLHRSELYLGEPQGVGFTSTFLAMQSIQHRYQLQYL